MINACYESSARKSNTYLFSFGISYKDIIVEEEIVSCDKLAYHHDEFRLREGEQKYLDQLLSLHFYHTKVEKSTFNIDISEGKDEQHKKVFPIGFYELVADYLELMSSIDIKIFLSEEIWLYHQFKTPFCWLCISLFFGSRSRISSADKLLTWLHWKHDVT